MSHRTLPYLPFADFISALDAIAGNPPAYIDSSCWSRLPSLNKRGRILCDVFQFLGLISSDGKTLPAIGDVLNTTTRAPALARVLRAAYAFVTPEALRDATMDRLKRTFGQRAAGKAISRKALSFYLKAAYMAGFELHALLLPRQRQRPRKNAPQSLPQLVEQVAKEESVLAALALEAGGSLSLRLEGQQFSRLTSAELERATSAALLLKTDRKPVASVPPVPRRMPVSTKSYDKTSRRA